MEVALPNLVHALKAGPSAEWVALKLTKKGPATYLTVEAAHVDGSVSVLQDVPIRVLSTADLARYGEPSLPHPTLRLSLPPAASMACVVERARAACATAKHITLAADSGAREVSLSAATEGVHIRTYYRGCGSGGDHRADASQGGCKGGGGGEGGVAGVESVLESAQSFPRLSSHHRAPLPLSPTPAAAAASVAVNIRDFGRVLRAVAGLNPPGQPAHQYEAILREWRARRGEGRDNKEQPCAPPLSPPPRSQAPQTPLTPTPPAVLCAGQSLVVHAPLVVAAQPGDGGEPASGALGPTEAMLPVGFLTFILATMDPQGSDGTG